jgi:hypothetical protein
MWNKMSWHKVFELPFTGVINPLEIHKELGIEQSTVGAWYGGYTNSTNDLLDITSNGITLIDGGAPIPVPAVTSLQGNNGNKLIAFDYDGTNNYHYKATANVPWFTSYWTVTQVVKGDTTLATGATCFRNVTGGAGAGGAMCQVNASKYAYVDIYKTDGAYISVTGPSTALNDGYYHIITFQRNGNLARVLVDGISGQWTDVSATNTAVVNADLYIATGSGVRWDGHVVYTRVNTITLTDASIQKEVMLWQGAGLGTSYSFPLEFSRASTAFQTYSNKTMTLRAINVPRVSSDVLIEESRTNLTLYSEQLDNVYWSKTPGSVSVTANAALSPDGNMTADTLVEGNAGEGNVVHAIYGSSADFAPTTYTSSVFIKYITGGRSWVDLLDSGINKHAYFNIQTGVAGTVEAPMTSGIIPYGNGWYRVYIVRSTGKAAYFNIAATTADATPAHVGDSRSCFYMWGAMSEAGSFPNSYIPTTTLSVVRSSDNLSIPPYKLRNTLKDIVATSPTMWLDFDVTPSAATIVDKSGSYTLTKAGQPKRYTSSIYGDYFVFDGTNDWLSIAAVSADIFNPTGDFSLVFVYTPNSVSGVHTLASKWDDTGNNKRTWTVFSNDTTLYFYISHNGSTATFAGVNFFTTIGKTVLITASYSVTGGASLYVDALAPGTGATIGTPYGTAASSIFYIGQDYANDRLNGKLHYLAYYNGTAISQVQHNAMYSALKLPGILPTEIAHDTHYKKLRIKGEYKHTALTDLGSGIVGTIVEIGNNSGSALTDKNRIRVFMYENDFYVALYEKTDATYRFMSKTVLVQNTWNSFDCVIDFGNLANSYGSVGPLGGTQTALTLDGTMTGSDKHFSFLDSAIKIGRNYADANYPNAFIRGLRIFVDE